MKKVIILAVSLVFSSLFMINGVSAVVCSCIIYVDGAPSVTNYINPCPGGCSSGVCGAEENCAETGDPDAGSEADPDAGSTGVGGGTAGGTVGGGGATLDNPLGATFEIIVKNVITAALGLTGVLALVAFIYGGLIWMVSGGDSAKIKKGKEVMLWAVFGIIVIFAAYAVLAFIFTALGVK